MSSKIPSPAPQSAASIEEAATSKQPERAKTEESELSLSAGDIQWTNWTLGQKKQNGTELHFSDFACLPSNSAT